MKRANQRRENVQARQKRRWRLSIAFTAVLLAWFVYSFFFDTMGFLKYLNMKRTESQLTEEIKALQERNARLRKDIDAVKNDPDTLETLARERLGMVHKDEKVYLVLPEVGRP